MLELVGKYIYKIQIYIIHTNILNLFPSFHGLKLHLLSGKGEKQKLKNFKPLKKIFKNIFHVKS